MAYLVPDSFRADSLDEAAAGMTPLTETDASDPALEVAIARLSQRIDDWTSDHFEPEAALTLDVDGHGGTRLYLPKRVRGLTSVKVRDVNGVLSAAVDDEAYRIHQSLNAAGTARFDHRMLDYLELVRGGIGLPVADRYCWPTQTEAVEVIGDFSWAEVPGDIQRALALLVWDHFKQIRANLRVAESLQTDTTVIRFTPPDAAAGIFSGIAEVDGIIGDYRRTPGVLVG